MSTLSASTLTVLRGGRKLLRSVNVSFETGCLTAILGPNGAGKSTLLNCLAGLLSPESGTVRVGPQALSHLPPRVRARQIGFLPQVPEIAWSIDVHTLVGLGRIPHGRAASDSEHAAAVARALDLTGTATWATREVHTLSGGERARVLFARVLAGESQWILADEPFAGLDPAYQFEMAALLRELAKTGRGVVFTVHDLTLAARIADRIVLMCDGEIVADGAPADALTPETLKRAYGIEAKWVNAHGSELPPFIAILGRHSFGSERRD